MALADCALVSSALHSCMWVLEIPQEEQHVNPDVKLTQRAAAVWSILLSRGKQTLGSALALLACLGSRARTSLLSSSASHVE